MAFINTIEVLNQSAAVPEFTKFIIPSVNSPPTISLLKILFFLKIKIVAINIFYPYMIWRIHS